MIIFKNRHRLISISFIGENILLEEELDNILFRNIYLYTI